MVPHISLPKRGFAPTAPLLEIVNAILYKLKTGVQWEYPPTASLFTQKVLSWLSVYHLYRKWCRSDTFLDCWTGILKRRGSFSTPMWGSTPRIFDRPVQEGASMPIYVSTNVTAVWMTGTNILTRTFMPRDMPWNAPMHGSIVSGHCSTGSIPPLRAGKGSTTYHS